MPKKIGIVIPCYNAHPEHIREAVASALAQDTPVDVVVVNDGSTNPDTLRALEDLSSTVRVIHTPNGGPAAARNEGIRALATELILPLDSDDRLSPNFAREASQVLQQSADIRIVYGQMMHFGEGSLKQVSPPEVGLQQILKSNQLPSCAMFRFSDWQALGGYDESLRVGYEDYEFWVRILARGGSAVQAPGVTFYYRIRSDSRHSQQGLELEAVRATRAAFWQNNPDQREKLFVEGHVALHLLNREVRWLKAENQWFHRRLGLAWRVARRLRDKRKEPRNRSR